MASKYYWLKLGKGFFKRHDIMILEGESKDYALFYLKLLVESIDHEGRLRYNDLIPYDCEMLASVTNTNIDTVRCAVEVLQRMELLEILDDGTIYMSKIEDMLGSETEWAEKKRIYRAKQKDEEVKSIECKPVNDDWFTRSQKIWEDTFALYPKKFAEEKGRLEWEKLVQSRPLIEDRIELAKTIYKAIKLYVDDYKEHSSEDTTFKYVPRFDNWMKDQLPVWEKRVRDENG